MSGRLGVALSVGGSALWVRLGMGTIGLIGLICGLELRANTDGRE